MQLPTQQLQLYNLASSANTYSVTALAKLMENASLSSDVWNDVTTSSSKDDDDLTLYLANIRDFALKIIYIIIGTVGVLDNVCRRP